MFVLLVYTECSTNNGGCEQLCLPKQSGYRCACSDTAILKADNKACKSKKLCPISFIIMCYG